MRYYAVGHINICGPKFVLLELINACLVAARRHRIDRTTLLKLVEEISLLQISWVDIETYSRDLFSLCDKFHIAAYDASYILSAQLKGCKLITADLRLYNAVKNSLPFVQFLTQFN
jgi:predicted nucleic acid-binding protein